MAGALAPAAASLTYLLVNAVGFLWPSGKTGLVSFNGGKEGFIIDKAQRCYRLTADWSKPLESATLKNFPDVDGQIAFFEASSCTGTHTVISSKANTDVDFKGTNIYKKKISSLIVWAYSVYPINGLVYATKSENIESTMLRATTNTSGSNFTVHYYHVDANSSWEENMDEIGRTPLASGATA